MKYIVLIGDGIADRPLESLGNKTPLQVARKPHLDYLAKYGKVGLVKTIPAGLPAGSDVANLSILGYDPTKYYTGRAPIEAAAQKIELENDQTAFRCNLVTVKDNVMVDYSADHISTEEAKELIKAINETLGDGELTFYSGVSYRHLLVIKGDYSDLQCTPPHDISGKKIDDYLPTGGQQEKIRKLMTESQKILATHPINLIREKNNKNPANMIWLWGQGKKPLLPSFYEKYNLRGAVISAVDLIKGLGALLGLEVIQVQGATGYLDTNYAGKVAAAISTLLEKQYDFVYLHVEAPDEVSHQGDTALKIYAIEEFDKKIVGPILRALEEKIENRKYRLLALSDHATPISLRTHADDPVPFVIYSPSDSSLLTNSNYSCENFNEIDIHKSNIYLPCGDQLMTIFLK